VQSAVRSACAASCRHGTAGVIECRLQPTYVDLKFASRLQRLSTDAEQDDILE
jgi:hypothetical protein